MFHLLLVAGGHRQPRGRPLHHCSDCGPALPLSEVRAVSPVFVQPTAGTTAPYLYDTLQDGGADEQGRVKPLWKVL